MHGIVSQYTSRPARGIEEVNDPGTKLSFVREIVLGYPSYIGCLVLWFFVPCLFIAYKMYMWLRDKMYLLFLGDNACDIVQLLYKLTDM